MGKIEFTDKLVTICTHQVEENMRSKGYSKLPFLSHRIPDAAIEKNSRDIHGPYNPMMFQREAKVLGMLIDEGYLKSGQE